MTHLIALSALLSAACLAACAMDGTSDAVTRSDHASGVEATDNTVTRASELQPDFTSAQIHVTFPDGCQIRFWCHNDNAAGDEAGFCILNACNGSAPAHAAAFCSNNCDPGACSAISDFGACN